MLERKMGGKPPQGVAEQLERSAAQIRRDRQRFYILPIDMEDGTASQLGLRLYGEDEDVIVVEAYFDPAFRDAIGAGLGHFLDTDSV